MPYYPATASHILSEEHLRKTAHPAVCGSELSAYSARIRCEGPRTKEEWEQAQKAMHELYFAITGLDWE